MTGSPSAPFGRDLLARPTELPVDPAVARLEAGEDPRAVAAEIPTSSAAWAALSEAALADDPVNVVWQQQMSELLEVADD